MLEKVKDGLLGAIFMGGKNYWSIIDVLKADYKRYKTMHESYGIAEYRGIVVDLELIYSDNESLYSNVKKQIDSINKMFEDGE